MTARRWGLAAVACLLLAGALTALGVWRARPPVRTAEVPAPSLAAPQRIASLTLASDEVLAALVPTERVLCVTSLADDPEISNVPDFYPHRVVRVRDSAAERILALSPDLVCVASYNSADSLEVLKRSGLTVYRSPPCQSIDEIEAGILDFGTRLGEPERAEELVGRMRQRRRLLAEQLRGVADRPRVLFWSAGFTAGRKTTLDDIIREAGAVNVAAERGCDGSVEIPPEQVIAADPTFILQARWSADEREGRIDHHPLLRHLKAVREDRVITIEGKYLTAVSHYVVEGAERLARQLHPERFSKDPSAPSIDDRKESP